MPTTPATYAKNKDVAIWIPSTWESKTQKKNISIKSAYNSTNFTQKLSEAHLDQAKATARPAAGADLPAQALDQPAE